MSMSADQAAFLREFLLSSHAFEIAPTRRVIGAIPAGQENHQADPKAFTAIALAHHIITAEIWFLQGILAGEFAGEEQKVPEGATIASLLAQYDTELPPLVAKIREMDPAALARPVSFFGMMELPLVSYLNFMVVHSVHHRGQLAASLRPMGGKVPSIYGPSADDKGGM
jgi:uncharacterized damage-inducible protein DinB